MLCRAPAAQTIMLTTGFAGEELDRAAGAAKTCDTVVFGLFMRVRTYDQNAIAIDRRYGDLIRTVASWGKQVVVCNFRNPWTVRELPKAAVCLCSFSDAEDSIEAAAQVLFGEISAKERLPITISPDYPFGYGL